MSKRIEISKKEKQLLNILGRNAQLSYKDLLFMIDYKREEIIAKKIKKLRELDILRGPYCDINLSALSKNRIYNIFADISAAPEDRDLIFEILTTIPGIRWIFPTQQEDKFFTQFQCNHYSIIARLLKLLEKKQLLTYHMAASQNRWITMNPDFFGPPIPDARTLLNPCRLPDLSYSRFKTRIKWKRADLIFMQYLQVETESKAEIRNVEYEKYGHFWKYSHIQSSIRKIESSGIIQSKDFHISPYPRSKCCTFILMLHASRKKPLLTALHNFGRECRIHKSYTVAGTNGFLFCWASTEIVPEIIAIFDTIEDVTTSGLFYLRTHTGKYLYGSSFEPALFNIENQRWEFPYSRVKRDIDVLMEGR